MKKGLSSLALPILLLSITCFADRPADADELSGPAQTIDELVRMADDEGCRGCHQEVHRQWRSSWHSRSLSAAVGIMTEYIEVGLKEEWRTPLTKEQLLKCLHCHAPVVEFASEELAERIADLIVAAEEQRETPEGEKALEELDRLNVGCITCHNLRATTYLTGLEGEPEPGVVYGPTGQDSPGHKTVGSELMKQSLFCMQCHGLWVAPDGELMTCATIPGSYRNAYLSRGGARTCQDCHMKAEGRGHTMPGGHDIAMVRDGLGLRIEIDPYRHLPGQVPGVEDPEAPVPSAAVTVFVENRAGHRVPDG